MSHSRLLSDCYIPLQLILQPTSCILANSHDSWLRSAIDRTITRIRDSAGAHPSAHDRSKLQRMLRMGVDCTSSGSSLSRSLLQKQVLYCSYST